MTGRRGPAADRAPALRSRRSRGVRRNARGRPRGMTLVELLMALVVLSIGVLSVAALFPLGRSTSTKDRLLTQATDLALQTMEQLRAKTYSDADLSAGTHPTGSGEWVGANSRFHRWWTVTQLTGSLSDVKQVDIRVTWTAAKPDTARLLTYFKR